MTSIQGHGRLYKKRTSKSLSGSLPPPEPSHDKTSANLPAIESLIIKYSKEDLQKIIRIVLKAQAPLSDNVGEKPLKARSPDVYCGKCYMEYYNFCQPCEDHFATTGAKGLNRILFAAFFLLDYINFRWQQYKRKDKAESTVPITWKEFKIFLCQSLGDSRAFVDSYWAKIKKDSQYQ